MNRQLNFIDSQRFDTPDIDYWNSSIEDEFKYTFNHFLNSRNSVIRGFDATTVGLLAKISRLVPRVCKDSDGLMFVDEDVTAVTLDYALEPNATNYVQARLEKVDTAYQLRAFYDVDVKEEFHKFTYTENLLQLVIEVNQTGFSAGAIKLHRFDTDATDVIDAFDERVFAFSYQDYTWATTRTDKDIFTQEQRSNAESFLIKEIKGTATWFDAPATNLQRIHDIGIATIDAQAAALFTGGLLSIPQFTIVMPNKAFNYTVAAVSGQAMADGDSLYVELPLNSNSNFDTPTGNLTAVKVNSSSYPNDSKYFLICTRVGDNVLFGKGNLKLADYSSEWNIVDGQSATKAISILDEKLKEVQVIIASPIYNEETTIGVGTNVVVNLPNNSRNGGAAETYDVGSANLMVMKDGQDMRAGEDYDEIDDGGGIGSSIRIYKVQDINTVIVFRKAIGGGAGVTYTLPGGGVSGATNYGSVGLGMYRSNAAGVLEFKRIKMGANITITDDGDALTISSTAGSGSGTIKSKVNKDTIVLPFCTPVCKGNGGVVAGDVDVLATSRFYGFTIESTDIPIDDPGQIQLSGIITGGATAIRARFTGKTFNDGEYIYIGEAKGEIMSEAESYDDSSYAVVKCGMIDDDDILIINDFVLDNI